MLTFLVISCMKVMFYFCFFKQIFLKRFIFTFLFFVWEITAFFER